MNEHDAVKRGEIYYIDKNPTYYATDSEMYAGRPGIVVSANVPNARNNTVQVVYCTTSPKEDAPTHVVIRSQARKCVACCDQIFTVSKTRMRDQMGTVSDREMQLIDAALMLQLGIGSPAPEYDTTEGIAEIRADIKALSEMVSGLLTDRDQTTELEAPQKEIPEQHKRNTVYSEFGRIIVDYRKQHNLSPAEFALKTGVSAYTVNCVIALSHKKKQNFSKPTLIAIAHACEIYGEEADRLIELRLKGE